MDELTTDAVPPGEGADETAPPRTPMGALLVAALLLLPSNGPLPTSTLVRIVVPLAAFVLIDGYTWIGAAIVALGIGAGCAWFAQGQAYLELVMLVAFGLGGIAMAVAAGRGFGPFVGGIAGGLPPALTSVGMFVTNTLGFREMVRHQLVDALALMKTAGYMPPQVSNVLPTFLDLWMRFYPMVLVVVLLCSATAVFLLAEVLIPLIGRPALHDGRFRFWKMPDGAVWLLIAGLALALSGREPLGSAGLNLAFIMVTLYGGVGLAIVRYFLLVWGLPTAVQVCITAGMFVLSGVSEMPLVPAFAVALGFLDTWMDFRGLETPRMHADEGRPIP